MVRGRAFVRRACVLVYPHGPGLGGGRRTAPKGCGHAFYRACEQEPAKVRRTSQAAGPPVYCGRGEGGQSLQEVEKMVRPGQSVQSEDQARHSVAICRPTTFCSAASTRWNSISLDARLTM